MPTIKTPKKYNLTTNLGFLYIVIPWLLVAALIAYSMGNTTAMKFVQLVWFVFVGGFLVYWVYRRQKDFICPQCKTTIPDTVENSGEDGEPILHYCKNCDVLWHTGNIPTS